MQRYRGAGNRRKSTIADQHFGERPIGSVSVLDLDQAKEIEEKIEILRKEGIVILGEASIREKIEYIRRIDPSCIELT